MPAWLKSLIVSCSWAGGLVAQCCLFVTLLSIACQAPLSMGLFRPEYWSGFPFPPPGDLPDPGSKPGSPALQADSLCLSHQGNPHHSLELKIPERLYYLSHASGRHSRKDSACLGTHLWINNHGQEDGLANWCGLESMPTLWVGSALPITSSSQVAVVEKNPPANAGDTRDMGSVPGSGRSPGGGNGNPLQYSCLENSMDRGDWQAKVHRIF